MAKSDPAPNEKTDNLVERTLANIGNAWRDIAKGAARSVGLAGPSHLAGAGPEALEEFMRDCLEARGGEVSARMRAAELGEAYLELDTDGRRAFLEVLARAFAVDEDSVRLAIAHYEATEPGEKRLAAENTLRRVLEPPRVKLLTQFTALPQGVKFLVDLRADLLAQGSDDPNLRAMDRDLQGLLAAWFDLGFLDLRRIGWKSSAALLEKLIAYEAVHEITSWHDLRNRLDSDRRCFALFHPRMPDEPLAFVEVALTKGIVRHIQDLLDEDAPKDDVGDADSAIFYSISNTQKGLRGISFGEYLIKAAVRELSHDLSGLKKFATLSPIPGFRRWLASLAADDLGEDFSEDELGGVKALGGAGRPGGCPEGDPGPARLVPRSGHNQGLEGAPDTAMRSLSGHLGRGRPAPGLGCPLSSAKRRPPGDAQLAGRHLAPGPAASRRLHGQLPLPAGRYREEPRGLYRNRPHRHVFGLQGHKPRGQGGQ